MNTIPLKFNTPRTASPGHRAVPDDRTDVKNKLENGNTHVQRGEDLQEPEKKCSKYAQNE